MTVPCNVLFALRCDTTGGSVVLSSGHNELSIEYVTIGIYE